MNGPETPVERDPYLDSNPIDRRIPDFVERHRRGLMLLAGSVLFAAVTGYVIVEAARERLIEPTRAAYLLLLAISFTVSATFFITSLIAERRLYVESHWGGLGGGLGGWRVSRSLVFLITTGITFALVVDALNERANPDLRERYRAALNLAARQRMRCEDRGVVSQKLVVRCTPTTDADYDRFWEQIKLANSSADDIVVLRVAAQTPAAQTPANQTAKPAPPQGTTNAPASTTTPAATPPAATPPPANSPAATPPAAGAK